MCQHTKQYFRTMENVKFGKDEPDVVFGDFHLTSDVTVQYFSWAEYDFMRPPKPKNESSMMVAAISNCVANRLDYMEDLMDLGVTIDSVGRCRPNKKIPNIRKGEGWQVRISHLISSHHLIIPCSIIH